MIIQQKIVSRYISGMWDICDLHPHIQYYVFMWHILHPKNIKIIIKGKQICRLHRRSPNRKSLNTASLKEYNKSSCSMARDHLPVSGHCFDSHKERFYGCHSIATRCRKVTWGLLVCKKFCSTTASLRIHRWWWNCEEYSIMEMVTLCVILESRPPLS